MTCCCGRPRRREIPRPTAGRALRRYLSDKQIPPPAVKNGPEPEQTVLLIPEGVRGVGRRRRHRRPADPKCPGQVAATGVQLLATAHPFHGCPPGVRREPGPFLHDQRATRRSTAQTGSLGQLERRRTSTNKCLFHMVNVFSSSLLQMESL